PGKGGMVANLAVLFANKIPVNLNFTASESAVKSAIRQADLDKFITADPFVRKFPSFPWPPTRDLIFIERLLPTIKKHIIKWVILSTILPAGLLCKILKLGQAKGDDEAVLLFTSGSSGEPKGVPLTHRNLLANVCQFSCRIALPSDSKLLGCLPLFHSFGCTVTLWYPVIEGLDLVTYPSPLETKRLAELIHDHQIPLMIATPTFLRGYLKRVEPDQLAPLKILVTGAEKLPKPLADTFEEKFGIRPMEGYGLTETSPATNVNLPEPEEKEGIPSIPATRDGSVGPLLPGLAAKMTHPSNGTPIPLTESGILWLKGPNIFPGYLNREDLSEEVFSDGWFKTNDVARFDDDGFFYIEGRMSRFSKIAGEMVPHETVEATIDKVLGFDKEDTRKVAVVGLPDEQKGEAIGLLSTVAGATLEQEVIDLRYKLLDEGIPSLWCPKTIIPINEIPVLASGKLDLKACQEAALKSLK
ncbi:MAG: AMP-binding protein, partial [Verrucomicrobiota bacterium]